jgi:zinc protease
MITIKTVARTRALARLALFAACAAMAPIHAADFNAASAASTATAPAAASAQSRPRSLLDYRQAVLDNGLTAITVEDFSCPIVAVQMWYHVGSKDERPDRRGFAHMFEHMMFRGTDRLGPTDHFDMIRRAGGGCNGATGMDRTFYQQTVPAAQLDLVLWLEAERMAFLKIDQDSFDTERKVVEEERRLYLGGPYGDLYEKALAEIFHVHPYRWAPIGRISDLRQSRVSELRDFWRRYYGPPNATLVIAGAVSHADAMAKAKRFFGWIPRGEDPPRVTVREPMPTSPRSVVIPQDNAPAPLVGLVWRGVPIAHKDRVPLDLLGAVLGDGRGSRLYRAMVGGGLAVGVSAAHEAFEQDGAFLAGAALPPVGGDIAKARAALETQIARIRAEKVTPRELLKARNQFIRDRIAATLNMDGKAAVLGGAATVMGGAEMANAVVDDARRATEDDLLRVAREYLDPNRALAVTVERNVLGSVRRLISGPGATEEDSPVTADRESNAPPPGRPGAVRPSDWPLKPPLAKPAAPRIALDHVRRELPNGLAVIVVSCRRAPFVSMNLYLRGGAWSESRPGACSMALAMLARGTAGRTEGQLADEMETYAISIDGSGGMDSSVVSASCLSEHLDRAAALMGEVVLAPAFGPEEFETLRKQALSGLAESEASPGYLADREFRRRLYGGHPYARSEGGETADVEALKVEDARQWWADFARPGQATLIFCGDVSEERAMELARKTFGGWKASGEPRAAEIPAPPPRGPTRIFLLDRPGAQSQIRVGQLGSLTRKSPLYFAGKVMEGYFGRGFGSRLNRSLRVEKGLTYGIGGGFGPQRLASRFSVGTFSKTESTPAAIRAILEEIDRLRDVKPTSAELEDTRSFLIGSFPLSHETPVQVAADLWTLEDESLPADWFSRMLAKAAVTSAEDCVGLARKEIDPSRLVIVVVGDAEKLRKPLEAIAPVTLVPPDAPAGPPSK